VIAEGVENEAQLSFLRAHQCDEIQGYYFCKPLRLDEIGDKLRGDALTVIQMDSFFAAKHVPTTTGQGHPKPLPQP
jgi:sensor c-di-GMP phosphodiesterase-like protein